MGTITKRVLPSGLVRWRAAYTDNAGIRRKKQFAKKTDAKVWLIQTEHDLTKGIHTPGSVSPTVKQAAALWLTRCQEKRLEPMTLRQYQQHVQLHILPYLGSRKLAEFNAPAINAYADQLRAAGSSAVMVRKIMVSLGSIFREARRRGQCATDPTSDLDLDATDTRNDPRPSIPAKNELQAIIGNATGRWRPVTLVALFCGLRASELRGLRWADIDFDRKVINVSQRADAGHRIGRLKSKAGYREIPCPPIVINGLREWKLVCPKGDLGLVFPNKLGRVESHANLAQRGLKPILRAAGIDPGKYGLHSLRHACASLWIESGFNPKQIQALMGHSSIKVTFDVYGHLFSDADADQKAAQNVQIRLLGA